MWLHVPSCALHCTLSQPACVEKCAWTAGQELEAQQARHPSGHLLEAVKAPCSFLQVSGTQLLVDSLHHHPNRNMRVGQPSSQAPKGSGMLWHGRAQCKGRCMELEP